MAIENVTVRALEEYTPQVAAQLGELVCFLTPDVSGEPIGEAQLREIIESDSHEQFVAELGGRIIGAATLSEVRGLLGKKAYLEDFVTDETVRGQGVGHQLWGAMIEWCEARDIPYLAFTSSYSRKEAHAFYATHGAVIRDETAPFVVAIKKEG